MWVTVRVGGECVQSMWRSAVHNTTHDKTMRKREMADHAKKRGGSTHSLRKWPFFVSSINS